MRRSDESLPARRDTERWLAPFRGEGLLSSSGLFETSPWQAMRRIQEDMDRLFLRFFEPAGEQRQSPFRWAPTVDVSESPREYCIEVDLPGINRDDIEVSVQNGILSIRAELRREEGDEDREYQRRERRWGRFERTMSLPQNVREQEISCEYADGVLAVRLPKSQEARPEARRIPVSTGDSRAGGAREPSGRQPEEERTPALAGAKGGERSQGRARKK